MQRRRQLQQLLLRQLHKRLHMMTEEDEPDTEEEGAGEVSCLKARRHGLSALNLCQHVARGILSCLTAAACCLAHCLSDTTQPEKHAVDKQKSAQNKLPV